MENTDRRKKENIKVNKAEPRVTATARRESYNSLSVQGNRAKVGADFPRGVRTEGKTVTAQVGARRSEMTANSGDRYHGHSAENSRNSNTAKNRKHVKNAKKRKHSFGRFLAIYSMIFLAVIAVGLVIFWNFISAYENSRHEHIIKDFLSDVTDAQIEELLGSEPLCALESAGMISGYIRERSLSPSFRCIKDSERYTDEMPVYSVTADGSTIAVVTLTPTEKSAGFGFEMYEVSAMTVGAGEGRRTTVRITAPKGATLVVNGQGDMTNYQKEEIAYPRASEWESDTSLLPLMTVYEIPGFVLLPDITAEDGEILESSISEYDGGIDVFFDLPESRRCTLELTVPESASVTLGGKPLTEEQITERDIAYESYADTPFNRAAGDYPTYCRYTVSGLLSEPARKVTLGDWELFPTSEHTENGVICETYAQTAASSYRAEIHAPSSAKVFVNGVELDGTYLKENGAIYDEIADLTDYIVSPISEQIYLVDMLYAEPTVETESADGTRDILTGEGGVYRLSATTDETAQSEHSALVETVITKYVEYTAAGYTDTDRSLFDAARDCAWNGSPAYNSITESRHSFAQNIPCTIRSLTVTSYDYKVWGENCFSCTVDFTAELKNFRNVTDKIEGATLYFAKDGDSWKLIKMLLS